MLDHSTPIDEIQQALIDETAALGGISIMQISPEQGSFMTMFTRLIGARDAVEIGTFTGYSSLAIARGLPADGHLLCCDVSEEWTDIARRYWERAGVADRITLRDRAGGRDAGRAARGRRSSTWPSSTPTSPATSPTTSSSCQRLRPNGVILVDNVLWSAAR